MWKLSSLFPYHSLLASCFLFFAGLVLLCYEKQHCSEMTEDNSLQDNEERNNLLSTSRSVAAAWDGNTFQPFSHGVIFWFSCAAQQLGVVIYGITQPRPRPSSFIYIFNIQRFFT